MKMAALQLMQQKANKDASKAAAANQLALPTTETAENSSEMTAQTPTPESDTTKEQVSSTDAPMVDQTNGVESPLTTTTTEDLPTPVVNGVSETTAPQNGQCVSPLEGKEAEETIPGLAQAKELAESLVAEDGSGIGTSSICPPHGLDRMGTAILVDNNSLETMVVYLYFWYFYTFSVLSCDIL